MKANYDVNIDYDDKKEIFSIDVALIPDTVRSTLPNKIKKLIKESNPSSVGKKSKNKGQTFERSIVNRLNERFKYLAKSNEDGVPEIQFTRTPRSGGIYGGANKARLSGIDDKAKTVLSGDIIVPNYFRFTIEAKNHAAYPIVHKLLTKEGDSKMNEWIKQAKDDTVGMAKWLIIFHINLVGDFCVFDSKLMDECDKLSEIGNKMANQTCIVPFDDFITLPDSFFMW